MRESEYSASLEMLAPRVQLMEDAIRIERELAAAAEDGSTSEDDDDVVLDVDVENKYEE